MTSDMPDRKYADLREQYFKIKENQQTQLDKALLTLTAAALGFSIVFVKDIAKAGSMTNEAFLIASWILFGLAIEFTVVSFSVSTYACRKYTDYIDKISLRSNSNKDANKRTDNAKSENGDLKKPKNFSSLICFLNYASLLSFTGGIISLLVFSILNLNK